jgi:hypothetical protein
MTRRYSLLLLLLLFPAAAMDEYDGLIVIDDIVDSCFVN